MNLTEKQQVQVMIDLDDKDLYNYIRANKRIYTIYKVNEEYIFLKKLKKSFECVVDTNQELYHLIKSMDKDFQTYKLQAKICKKYTDCNNWKEQFDLYIEKANNTRSDKKREEYIMHAYMGILTCFDSIDKTPGNIRLLNEIRKQRPKDLDYDWHEDDDSDAGLEAVIMGVTFLINDIPGNDSDDDSVSDDSDDSDDSDSDDDEDLQGFD